MIPALVRALKLATMTALAATLLTLPVQADSPTLHGIARAGDVVALQPFLASGADLDTRNDYGSTPLTIAVTFGRTELVQALIKGGANLDLEGSGGSTPLHLAAFFGRTGLVQMLLASGADPLAQNAAGSTAYQVAAAPFKDDLPTYQAMARALKPRGLTLDLQLIAAERVKIAEILHKAAP